MSNHGFKVRPDNGVHAPTTPMGEALKAARVILGLPYGVGTEDQYVFWSFENRRKIINEFKRHA